MPLHRSLLPLAFAILAATLSLASPDPEYAENYTLEERDGYRLLEIRNTWVGSGDTVFRYALAPRDKPLPKLPSDVLPIRVPVQRLVIMATTYLGPIQALDLHDTLVGVAYYDFVNDPIARERVESGKAKRLPAGAATDIEAFLRLKPDLILASSTGNPIFDVSPQLARAKLPLVMTAAYMERHPLARAEWIEVIGAFCGKEAEAAAHFEEVETRYNGLAALAANAESRPTVFTNAPWSGIWHVPGGQSYTARALADAGAQYVWADEPGAGGRPIDLEIILQKAADADFWLHPSDYRSLDALKSADERFIGFEALREGRVFNNTRRAGKDGGNEIFERAVVHPEEVLADLIKIFHPELLPERDFVYYERLN